MSRRKKPAESTSPSNIRVAELVALVVDETAALGPLDREDLQEALLELVELRVAPTTSTAPQSAAGALAMEPA